MENTSSLHLKHLIAHAHDGILIADENGVVIVWNPALEQITGITHRDAVGTPLTSLFTQLTAANDEVWNPALVDALGGANVTPEIFERQIERPNHELRTIQLATFTTATRHGCQTTSIVRDITARRNADITLQTLLRAIDQSPTTVLITDGEGRIEYANPRLTTLTGYTLEEIRGQTPRIFQSGHTKIEVYEQLWDTVKRGHEWHGELLNKKKNGELYWEAIHISPIIDEAGAITHFLAIKEDVTARKRAEEALARSEYTLKRSQRIAHIGDWTWDIQTNTVTWSDEMFRIFNVDPTTFTGDLNAIIESAIHPDDRASLLTANQAVVNDQKPASLEYRVIWPDGSVRYIWAQPGEASFDERGNIFYLSGIVQDITERKLNEFALRESEVRFRTLVGSMDDIVFTLDKEQRHTGLYGRWLEKYQLPAEVFLGKTSREMLDAQTAEMHEAANQRVLNGEIVIYEWSDGRSHVQTSLTPLLDEQGQVSGIVGVGRDITEQKRAELELQRAHKELAQLHEDVSRQNQSLEQQVQQRTAELLHVNEQLSAIVNNISDGIVLLNTDDVIENTNPAFDNMFGYRRHEMYGRHYSEMVTADFEQTVAAALAKVRASGSVQRIQVLLRCNGGRSFDADIAIASVANNQDHVVCSVRDITHMKEIERVKDQFVSMVSHELRTPVSSILLGTETLSHYYDRISDAQKLHKIERIHRQAAALGDLVTAILDISRFEARRNQPHHPVDVGQLLQDVAADLKPQAEAQHQQFDLAIEADHPVVWADKTDIARIWRNLISNAIKYSGEHKSIRVWLRNPGFCESACLPQCTALRSQLPLDIDSGRYIVGFVQDNGPGIAEQDQLQLFTRFFRGWAAGTNIPGTGLGLSLVRDILTAYHGDIIVHSAPNQGTTFCFWLPVEAA